MDKEKEAKEAANETMRKTYAIKSRGLEIKIGTMDLLYEQIIILAKKARSCQEKDSETYLNIVEKMAMLGQAILPD